MGTESQSRQSEILMSVRLPEDHLQLLGSLSVVSSLPIAEEIRRASERELEEVTAGVSTLAVVLERGQEDLSKSYQLVSFRITQGFLDTAIGNGFADVRGRPRVAPLIRAAVATHVEKCSEPEFPARLAAANAENAKFVTDYINRPRDL